jgi:hypothetical protein
MKDHVNAETEIDLDQPLPTIWHELLKLMTEEEARDVMRYARLLKTRENGNGKTR